MRALATGILYDVPPRGVGVTPNYASAPYGPTSVRAPPLMEAS